MQTNLKRRAFALAGVASALALGGLLTACKTPPTATVPGAVVQAGADQPPPAPREFRAAWVSTVANIDWPSKQNLTAQQQQAEAIAILDRAKAMNLNAIVLQVRPSADAIYASNIEPWSEYLTGTQGKPPQPWYDPLKFWIAEAHARGLELHAWFNPYRARHNIAKSPAAPNHISRTNPAAVKQYGNFLWMDPGEESASKQTLDVVLDVVKRYDVDGVHIDDYFYPYPIEAPNAAGNAAALDGKAAKAELDFPDQASWQRYVAGGGKLDKPSWRRDNVNRLIEGMYEEVHHEKSWVRVGISPFGIGRPDRRPPTISGFSQYDKLYADAETWLQKGWVDYLSPQLYWPVSQTAQAYDTLLDYWIGQNTQGRHIWPGMFTSRIGAPSRDYQPQDILQQIDIARSRPGAGGHVHFSMVALMENRKGLDDQLMAGQYAQPALVPASPWLGSTAPSAPKVSAARGGRLLKLNMTPGKGDALYAVWTRYGSEWRFSVVPAAQKHALVTDDAKLGEPNAVFVSAVDRLGNESERVKVWGK
ncbi:glycoside hydrolase family 10 protein [Massilia terrae]|uniref:Family 10 glycosylhydrolase n=1 Tax=Massilia terrae TaxID=1811224 RepID=A0ABT2D0V9_9BURK|nr:family 10 glycosylhydrolase [Massilia terrae]MCS0659863.1 family 10 glycosylhydrolase [Massilia terrae]